MEIEIKNLRDVAAKAITSARNISPEEVYILRKIVRDIDARERRIFIAKLYNSLPGNERGRPNRQDVQRPSGFRRADNPSFSSYGNPSRRSL